MSLSNRGFSFIEIIVVVAILGVLGTLGTVFYTRFFTQNAVSNTTDHLVSQLRKAQLYALEGKQDGGSWGVNYTTSPKQIQLYLNGNSAFNENYSVNSNITISPGFNLLFARVNGIPGGATLPLTITISGNNSSESITINSFGVVSRN